MDVYVRWMIRRDMHKVLVIERQSFEQPWEETDFLKCLLQRNCIGMVAEYNEEVVGYMLYELKKTHLDLFNFAVCPRFRFQGVGRTMIDKIASKLSPGRRHHITTTVRETNLDAQLFFKACNFFATRIIHNMYDDEDAYMMRRNYELQASNRISQFLGEKHV